MFFTAKEPRGKLLLNHWTINENEFQWLFSSCFGMNPDFENLKNAKNCWFIDFSVISVVYLGFWFWCLKTTEKITKNFNHWNDWKRLKFDFPVVIYPLDKTVCFVQIYDTCGVWVRAFVMEFFFFLRYRTKNPSRVMRGAQWMRRRLNRVKSISSLSVFPMGQPYIFLFISPTKKKASLIYHQWWKYKTFVGFSSGQHKKDK